jgi:poly-gamma-glutamate synthesis protein (capsule biosynthesis protein)
VLAGGDILIHPELTAQAAADGAATGTRDFRPLLAGVQPAVAAADLAICHMEVPLAGPDGPFTGWPAFGAPPEIATALAATGYDECSTASNHAMDRGSAGVRGTLDALDAARIGHTGSARSAEEARTPRIVDVDGIRVGHVSFTVGLDAPAAGPAAPSWLVNDLTADGVLTAARAAKAAGADVVIASLHWGNEFQPEPTAEQQALARRLLADDAVDLIIGHAHAVQPFEQIGGKWVAYGLGNALARHAEPLGTTEEGVLARFRFARGEQGRWRVDRVDYLPTLIDFGPPIRLLDITGPHPSNWDSERQAQTLQRIDTVVRARAAPLSRLGG